MTTGESAARPGASRRAPLAAIRRVASRTPLRVKLIATLLLLVIAALVGSGVAATATLRDYLVGRVDNQLEQTKGPILDHGLAGVVQGREPDDGAGGIPGDHGGRDTGPGRLPSEFVIEVTRGNGSVAYKTSALLDSAQPLPALPRVTGRQTKARGSAIFTVPAVSGGGQWRVLAVPVTLTNGSAGTLMIAQSLSDVNSTVNHLVILLLVIGATAVVVLAAVGYLVVRASMRPLRAVERTAAQIAAGDLSHRVPHADPRTEVGHLAGALNTMLHEIEAAFAERAASEETARRSEERMRRFVADASHELRTPLTSIRGFAELYRQGAASDAAAIGRLMRRIEDEAKRMGLLVEDLLMLARLDQQRPFARLPVDLLALANDVVHDAQVIAPDRQITLDVGRTDPPPIVIGDDARLRQVVANLVNNALQHTPPGTPVTVRIATGRSERSDRHTAVITVEDHGPGMTAEDAARVFERFYQADRSRNRDAGGAGLGLAIVSAIVAGHGGTVEVQTQLGAGASFRVELPIDS